MKNILKIAVALTALLAWQGAMGATEDAEGSNETALNRMNKRLEANLGLNNAGPAGIGLGAGYTLNPWLKAVGGYSQMKMTSSISVDGNGNTSTGTTTYTSFAAGAQIAVPTWNFTPIGGLNVAHYSVSSNDSDATFSGMKGSGTMVYTTLGANFQTHGGFMGDFGFNVPLGHANPTAFVDLGYAFL